MEITLRYPHHCPCGERWLITDSLARDCTCKRGHRWFYTSGHWNKVKPGMIHREMVAGKVERLRDLSPNMEEILEFSARKTFFVRGLQDREPPRRRGQFALKALLKRGFIRCNTEKGWHITQAGFERFKETGYYHPARHGPPRKGEIV